MGSEFEISDGYQGETFDGQSSPCRVVMFVSIFLVIYINVIPLELSFYYLTVIYYIYVHKTSLFQALGEWGLSNAAGRRATSGIW